MKIFVFPSHLPDPWFAGEAVEAVKRNDKTESCFAQKRAAWLALVQRLTLLVTVQVIGRYLWKCFPVSRELPVLASMIIAL